MYDYKETMDKLIQDEVNSGQIRGASALVLHKDKEIYFHNYGYADKEKGMPMRRDTIIRLYSMTKPITAAAVMILAERGEIDLRDAVSKYLPAFAGQKVWNPDGTTEALQRENTIWDLLNMTSGIPYPDATHEPGRRMDAVLQGILSEAATGHPVSTLECINRIASVPLCFQPGEQWMYGFSADVLGGIVETVSGMSYGEFLQKELFDPLDMKDTGFCVPKEKRERFAQIYEWKEDRKTLEPYEQSHLGESYGEDIAFESGGAGLTSTIDDYSHFATMLLHKGIYKGKRILGRKTVEFMSQNHLSESQHRTMQWDTLTGYGYGCLMRVLMDRGGAGSNASVGEYGWDGWTGNYVTIDPEEEMILIYFMQRCGAGTTPLVRKLRMATYAAL